MEWLVACQVTHVAMESTDVYWKPLYNLLEATGLTVFVVNAAHMKAVPGRKTDVQDAVWICDLMQHGLLKPSFIPARPQRELRELVRYRISLIQERADEANRIQKVLEGGNIKLGSVVSNIRGKSGRHILAAIAVGGCILEIAYFVLRDGVAYQELGVNYYDERKKDAVVRNAVKRLERLGFELPSNRQPNPPPLGGTTFFGGGASPGKPSSGMPAGPAY